MAEAASAKIGSVAGPPDTVEELLRARLSLALGGWRGAVESAVPTIVFVVVWNLSLIHI